MAYAFGVVELVAEEGGAVRGVVEGGEKATEGVGEVEAVGGDKTT